MTYFLRSGSRYMVSAKNALDLCELLPIGTYTVRQDPMSKEYYLDQIEDFEIRGKVYGDTKQNSKRILNTFNERPASTGVMLSGEKGSGKTLLAKMLSLDAMEKGTPTIVINQPWHGEGFNSFIQSIEQPIVVIFDEFEKVYDSDAQEKMLTLLDGVYPSKKLFVITCNDKWRVNEHMRNRPGRLYYRLDFGGLEKEFIEEYCNDNLENKSYIPTICRIAVMFGKFNFDILKALVEEMNRYGESPQDVMKVLNAKPELSDSVRYKANLRVDGIALDTMSMVDTEWRGNPLGGGPINLNYYVPSKKDDDDDNWELATFQVSDLVKVDADTGHFHFVNEKQDQLSLVKIQPATYNYDAM